MEKQIGYLDTVQRINLKKFRFLDLQLLDVINAVTISRLLRLLQRTRIGSSCNPSLFTWLK